MILAAHQPQYLSYPGIFDKMDRADVFVFLDNVQYMNADLRLITLCKKLGCDTYLAGQSGRNYMDLNVWEKHGIQVNWRDFQLEPYKQLFPGWVENLSTVDLLLCLPDPLDHIRGS